jgi:hypothetical protein
MFIVKVLSGRKCANWSVLQGRKTSAVIKIQKLKATQVTFEWLKIFGDALPKIDFAPRRVGLRNGEMQDERRQSILSCLRASLSLEARVPFCLSIFDSNFRHRVCAGDQADYLL